MVHQYVLGKEVQRLNDPSTIRLVIGGEVLKLELVVGLVVGEVDATSLRSHRKGQSRDALQQCPGIGRGVTSVELEGTHRPRVGVIIVLDLNGADPLVAIIVQRHRDAVGGASVGSHVRRVVSIKSVRRVVANTSRRRREVPDVGFGLVGHQTHRCIKIGSLLLCILSDDSNRNHIASLAQVLNGSVSLLKRDRASRQGNDTIKNIRITIGSHRRIGESAGDVMTPRLVSVHVHDASILVADAQNEARHLGKRVDGEDPLVELDLVGRLAEASTRALLPPAGVFAKPVLRHLTHLVVPLSASSNGGETQVVGDVVALVAVVTNLQHQVFLILRKDRVDVEVRLLLPGIIVALQRNVEALRRHAIVDDRIGVGRIRVTHRDVQKHLVIRSVANMECLTARTSLEDTSDAQHGSRALHEGEGDRAADGSRSRLRIDRVHGLRSALGGNSGDGAGGGINGHAVGKRGRGSAVRHSKHGDAQIHRVVLGVIRVGRLRIRDSGSVRERADEELQLGNHHARHLGGRDRELQRGVRDGVQQADPVLPLGGINNVGRTKETGPGRSRD